MVKRYYFLLILFFLFYQSNSIAQGETTLSFLNWEIDPVTLGMGGSSSADGAGIFSIHQNPAFINQTQTWDVGYQNRSFSDLYLPGDWKYFNVAGTWRINAKHIIGVYWKKLEMPQSVSPGWPQDFGTPKDYAIGLVYGRQFSKRVNGGISVKYLHSDLLGASANSWAFDVGLNVRNLLPIITRKFSGEYPQELRPYILPDNSRGINLGLALLNAGPGVSYIDDGQKDPIPQVLRLGFSAKLISSPVFSLKLLGSFEKFLIHRDSTIVDNFAKAWFTAWKDEPFKRASYHTGFEATVLSILSYRMGLRHEPFQDYFEKTIYTMGFGLKFKYVAIEYGKWIDKENTSHIYRDSNIIGIRIGNIR